MDYRSEYVVTPLFVACVVPCYGSPNGRNIRFGVREHGMAAVLNGLAAHGGVIPYGSTFFNFITYAAGAVRLSALARHGV